MTDFGIELRRLRRAKTLTQKQVAERAGLHFTFLSKAENGRVPLSEPAMRRLAEVLGCDPDHLILLAGRIPAALQPEVARLIRAVRRLPVEKKPAPVLAVITPSPEGSPHVETNERNDTPSKARCETPGEPRPWEAT